MSRPVPLVVEDPHVANAYRCRCGERHHPRAECSEGWPEERTAELPILTDADLLQQGRAE